MLPYYPQPQLVLFDGYAIHAFGALVAIGVLVGNAFARRRARQAGIAEEEIDAPILWALVVGFISAHLIDIFVYHPERLASEGWFVLLKLWDGMSSYGGYVGGAAAMLIYYALKRPRKPILLHGDFYMQGLLVGFVFGRLGCTLAHDHPGRLTDFPLAFAFPDGPRHDLGFYEFLFLLLVLLPGALWLHRRRFPPGSQVAFVAVLYPPIRFLFETLRATDVVNADVRWLGMTPAQYASLAMFASGVWLTHRIWRRARHASADDVRDRA